MCIRDSAAVILLSKTVIWTWTLPKRVATAVPAIFVLVAVLVGVRLAVAEGAMVVVDAVDRVWVGVGIAGEPGEADALGGADEADGVAPADDPIESASSEGPGV